MNNYSRMYRLLLVGLILLGIMLTQDKSLLAVSLQNSGDDWPKAGEMVLTSTKDIARHIFVADNMLKKGDYKGVIAICQQILALDASHIGARAYMAAAYKGLGENEKYQQQADIVIEQSPGSPVLYQALAAFYHSVNDLKNIEKSYKQGIKIASDTTGLQMGLAGLYLKEGRLEEAEDLYLNVLKEKGLSTQHFLNANFSLCQLELENKLYDKVLKRAGMLTDLYSPLPQGYLFLAAAYIGKGQSVQAVKVYKELIRVAPDLPLAYHKLALLYNDKLEDRKTAFRYANEAVRKFPDDAGSLDMLGWILFNDKKYSLAVKQFESAVRLEKNKSQYLYHLGLGQQELGEKVKAREAFRSALALIDKDTNSRFSDELNSRIDQCR